MQQEGTEVVSTTAATVTTTTDITTTSATPMDSTAMTRSSSTNSSSAMSNITVAAGSAIDDLMAIMSDSPERQRVIASTPPTSLGSHADSGSLASSSKRKREGPANASKFAEEENGDGQHVIGRRPKRSTRNGVSTYNLKKLSDAQQAEMDDAGAGRNVSGLTGRTLVGARGESDEDERSVGTQAMTKRKEREAMDLDFAQMGLESSLPKRSSSTSAPRMQRRPSVREKVKKSLGKVGSVLGKRGRDVMEAGKRAVGMGGEEEATSKQKKNRLLDQLDTGVKGILDEMDLDAELEVPVLAPPAKKVKLSKVSLGDVTQALASASSSSAAPVPKGQAAGKRMKAWQKEGLYVGQLTDSSSTQAATKKNKLQKPRPASSSSQMSALTTTTSTEKRPFMGLPMFAYLDKTRDFTIPYDVFAPTLKKGDEKPKDWHQINRNRLVGEAKTLWEKSERLPASMCVCSAPSSPHEQGCDEQCLNRVMQYECNDDNCALPASACSNRAFYSLAARTKKGGAYDIGVEVLKTPNRGFGVRSCRSFSPGQIIMEYTGEIISEAECQRRMHVDYKDKQCYYLMELERGLIIDGTKGSMARFINHSCEPNCDVRMVKVNGTPRMGVFAGENGVVTGEELTYDYNFDNFGERRQVCYCGAPTCRGSLSKRLNATEMKKLLKEEAERERLKAEAVKKGMEELERKKEIKEGRGASWRGWVAVDDPETKERLKREKREREEAEKTSSRAMRLAARKEGGVKREPDETSTVAKERDTKRRKTIAATSAITTTEETTKAVKDADEEVDSSSADTVAPLTQPNRRHSLHARPVSSSGSKFIEDLPPQISESVVKVEVPIPKLTDSTSNCGAQDEENTVAGAELPLSSDAGAVEANEPLEVSVAAEEGPVQSSKKREQKKRVRKDDPLMVKEAVQAVGRAVKNSFSSLGKGGNGSGSGSGSGSAAVKGELKQIFLPPESKLEEEMPITVFWCFWA